MNSETVQIEVPKSALVAAFLEQVARASMPFASRFETVQLEPKVGDAYKGGIFAGLPNVILTPHIAGVTDESNTRVSWVTVENVKRVLSS